MLRHSNSYFEEHMDESGRYFLPPTACCALGGAALASGFQRQRDISVATFLLRHWGALLEMCVPHPVRGDITTVEDVIHGLNSTLCYHWSRERIADWVATVEPHEGEEVPHATTESATAADSRRTAGARDSSHVG